MTRTEGNFKTIKQVIPKNVINTKILQRYIIHKTNDSKEPRENSRHGLFSRSE